MKHARCPALFLRIRRVRRYMYQSTCAALRSVPDLNRTSIGTWRYVSLPPGAGVWRRSEGGEMGGKPKPPNNQMGELTTHTANLHVEVLLLYHEIAALHLQRAIKS